MDNSEYEKKAKNVITKKTIDNTLQLMVNAVEGDTTQLVEEHAEYAKRKGWLKGFQ